MELTDLARRYYDLFNERRFDEAGQLVDPEAIFHYVPTKQRLVGRAGYRALVAAWVIAFEDAYVRVISIRQTGSATVHIDFVGEGTHTGDLVMGEALVIPASGIRAELPFTDTLTFQHSLITESRFDFDVAELQRRLTDRNLSKNL